MSFLGKMSNVFFIFFLIIFFMFISLNAAEYMNNVDHVQRVSGEDETDKNSVLNLEQFRVLLGFTRIDFKNRENKFLDAEPPSPVSIPLTFHHPHHLPRRRRRREPPEPAAHGGGDRVRIILGSVSGGVVLIFCAVGLIWGLKNIKKQGSSSESLCLQNVEKKVCLDPDLEIDSPRFNQEEESQKDLIKTESCSTSLHLKDSLTKSHSSEESFHSADSFRYSFDGSTTPPPLPPPPPPPPPPPTFSLKNAEELLSTNVSVDCRNLLPQIPLPPRTPSDYGGQPLPPQPPDKNKKISDLGKNGSPLRKLKPLHWDKLRAATDGSMVWDKLRTSSFEFDEDMIESLFGYNNPQDSRKNGEDSPSKHVLEHKRLQNITILFKALNATSEQICDGLLRGSGLSLQQLETLVKMEPTKEEESKLKSFKEDVNELGSAEKFVIAILKIPFAFLRIEVMLYKETFEDEIFRLRKSFSMLEEACKELKSSRLFLKLLEAVLKTGNRMNVGTKRGGAHAFKLDTLLKLADVKGTDGKTTLLHFVVQEIAKSEGLRSSDSIIGKINQKSQSKKPENKEEEHLKMGLDLVSGLCTELCNVKKTATIDMEVLASSIKNLNDEMVKLKNLLKKDLIVEEKCVNDSGFLNSMKGFLIYVEKSLEELKDDESRVLLSVREITEYFHGGVCKDSERNVLGIFVIVRDFLGMLDHVCRELRSIRIPTNINPLASFS